MATHPTQRKTVTEARQLVDSIQFSTYSDAQERTAVTWQRIQQTLHDLSEKKASPAGRLFPLRPSLYWVAAAVVGVLVFSGMLFRWYSQNQATEYGTIFGEIR